MPDRPLRLAAAAFLVGFVLHNADHARRGVDAVTDHVVWGGTMVAILAAVVLTLIATRHPTAPDAAFVIGFTIAAGVSATHLLPSWGVLSDSLPSGDVDALTWLAVLAEIIGAIAVGAVGWRVGQVSRWRRRSARPAT